MSVMDIWVGGPELFEPIFITSNKNAEIAQAASEEKRLKMKMTDIVL